MNIKDLFGKSEETPVKWDLHWYAHIVSPRFNLVSVDHVGLLQPWLGLDRPHLGEQVWYKTNDEGYIPEGRYVNDTLPIQGTVVDVIHAGDGIGGTMLLYSDTILVRDYPEMKGEPAYHYISDDLFHQIVAQRALILAGELYPRNGTTYSILLDN